MARQKGTLRLGSNFEAQMDAPLDAREIVALKADLTDPASFPYKYVGMQVFVKEEKKRYTLIDEDTTQITSWKLEESGGTGTGSGSLASGLEAAVTVGGIQAGTTYAAGEDLESILRDMLYPLTYPTFSEPEVVLTTSSPRVYEIDTTPTVNLTAVASRGVISPANGTNGKRAGEVTEYSLVEVTGSENTTGTWTDIQIDNNHRSITSQATFAAGEQPKDSHGNDYDVAYPGGVKTSPALTFEFVKLVWSNVADITTMAKESPKPASTKQFIFNFPAQTIANPECFSIPKEWTVSKIEVLNDLSGKYEDCTAEFTVTDETRPSPRIDYGYKKYTDNRGYNADARTIRVTLA